MSRTTFHRLCVLASALLLLPQGAHSVDIANTPLYLSTNLTPNVVMTLDDSGSMAFAFIPDSLDDNKSVAHSKRYTSSVFNGLYYNPANDYPVPTRRDGVAYTTSFTSARFNGFNAARGTVNLSNDYIPVLYQLSSSLYENCRVDEVGWNEACTLAQVNRTGQAAFYHRLKSSCSANSAADIANDGCYEKVEVGSNSDNPGRTSAQNKQNFANWYSFYKTRALSAISGTLRSVDRIDDGKIRFGWQTLNRCDDFDSGICKDDSGNEFDNRLKKFDSARRSSFYDWLVNMRVRNGTPLRSALYRVGGYFEGSGKDSPYAEDPYIRQGVEYACRANFHLMFTDGYWNGSGPDVGNSDKPSGSITLPDGKKYSARVPFRDDNSNSLADVAFYLWKSDLRSNLANKIKPRYVDRNGSADEQYWNPVNSVSSWQNVVNYTIGFGLGRALNAGDWTGDTFGGFYQKVKNGSAQWPSIDTDQGRVYDLWHAAINSRGRFYSADDPENLARAFADAFDAIQAASPSAAALTSNSTQLTTATLVFQARFNSENWSGQLEARTPQADGSVSEALWDASKKIPAADSRKIFVKTSSGSVALTAGTTCSALDASMRTALGGGNNQTCNDRLNWLRGDASKEVRNNGTLRDRPVTVLGDIINSDPSYAGAEDMGWSQKGGLADAERTAYPGFLANKRTRLPAVYVGANDGMLHAFRADANNDASGSELFAFIPTGVAANLAELTKPEYSHRYFVDGSPTVADAYVDSAWKTVLVSGLGKGGRSVFALDVSKPETFGTSNILWEFTDAGMGYSFSRPQIAKLASGDWVAIFGSGFGPVASDSSQTADPVTALYVVNLSNGALLKKITASGSNGLATPVLYDSNNDGVTDAAYAGDLAGNLWEFDLSGNNRNQWQVANSSSPLFAAGTSQPVTAQPALYPHPQGGVMVLFGTGRYLASADISSTAKQGFYGIWDKPQTSGTVAVASLQQQSILAEASAFGRELRRVSANTVDWASKRGWFLDLQFPAGTATGERVVFDARIIDKSVAFTTVTPIGSDPCEAGGKSWFMEIDAVGGNGPSAPQFDLNGDGLFDDNDLVDGWPPSGVALGVGIAKPPVVIDAGPIKFKFFAGTSGGTEAVRNRGGLGRAVRLYWRQLL